MKRKRHYQPKSAVSPANGTVIIDSSARSLSANDAKLYQTQITPVINELVGSFLQFAPKDRKHEVPYEELINMVATSPIVAIALEVKTLFNLSTLGKYTHPDQKIQDFVHANEEGITSGRFKQMLAKALLKDFVGWSAHEFTYRKGDRGYWYLGNLVYLPPNLSKFRGQDGNLTEIYYTSKFGYKQIPLEKIFHLVNQGYLDITSSAYGLSAARRMLALWKSLQVVMTSLMIACPKQAFPFLVGYADTNRMINKLDENNQPVTNQLTGAYLQESAARQLSETMRDIQNQSAVVVDKNNKVESVNQQGEGKLLFQTINLLMRMILLTLLIPSVPLFQSEGGSGDSNLASTQMDFMLSHAANCMEEVANEVVDQLHKPLIIANFGEQEAYGHYEINRKLNETQQKIYSIVGDLTQKGVLSQGNIELGSQILQDLGLPWKNLGNLNLSGNA